MHGKRRANERGANLVEAAVVVPLLVILLVVVVDLGRAYFTYIALIDAAREGARYGSAHPTDPDREQKLCDVALGEAKGQIVPVTLSCSTAGTTWAQGSAVKVRVTADNFPLLLGGLLGRPTIPMSYSAAFRIRCEVGSPC
jgi:Flp pilus assembly protein TadG